MSDGIVPKGQPIQGDPEKKGWLFKWTNYLKGYQRRWFVLSNGLLSYYRNQAEMAHTCRGTISLLGALIHTADSCTFVISNGGTQTFHIRAHDEVERQSWVTALELAKAKAIRAQESDDDDDQMSNAAPAAGDGEGEDAGGIARELAARFHDLRTCSELVARHGAALQRSLVDLEIPPSDTTKQVSERATLFRISCNAMMNACSEFMSAAATSSARMSRALQHEREQKMRLQEVVEQLARQHDNLEKNINARGGGNGAGQGNETEDEDHEFFDAVEDGVSTIMDDKTSFVMKVPVSVNRKAKLKSGESSDDSEAETVTETQQAVEKQLRSRDEEPASKRISTEKQTPLVSSAVEKQRRNREEEPASKRISTEKLTAQGSTSPAVEKERRSREEEPASKRISTEKETAQVSSAAVEKERRSREEEPASKRISTDKETAQVSSAVEKERRSREEEPASKLVGTEKLTAQVSASPAVEKERRSREEEPASKLVGTEKLTAQEPTSPVVFVEEAEAESSMAGAAAAADAAGQPPAPAAPPPAPPGAAAAPAALAHTDGQEEKINKDMKIWPHVSAVMSYVDGHPRRTRVPDKPNYPLSLWSIMKNCIGKELSKIPIPVNFSEPLSMLQRLTEEYEYSSVLDQAAQFSDPAHQLAYVAAFTVSSYATTAVRTSKPFNPLLGETYECDRMADLGWRSISEQVSHHPPMVAQWCEGAAGWQCWQEFTMTTKFRGKYLQVIPLGGASAMFPASGNKYTWRKVTTTVHNIIVGKLWVDNHGDMDIVGEAGPAAGYVAHLKYQPYGYFSKDTQRKVTGVIKDPQGVPRYVLQGHWDDRVEVAPVTSASADNTQCKTGKFALAWQRVAEPPDSDKWYNFTLLAAQLNEMENGVAPTDSRVRPDQRLMEEGLWDEANKEKLRLEEKQRAKRRALEAAAEAAAARGLDPAPPPAPAWFTREAVSAPGAPILRHLYNHRYWECKQRGDWAGSPDIF